MERMERIAVECPNCGTEEYTGPFKTLDNPWSVTYFFCYACGYQGEPPEGLKDEE